MLWQRKNLHVQSFYYNKKLTVYSFGFLLLFFAMCDKFTQEGGGYKKKQQPATNMCCVVTSPETQEAKKTFSLFLVKQFPPLFSLSLTFLPRESGSKRWKVVLYLIDNGTKVFSFKV